MIVLDTHVWAWWVSGSQPLPAAVESVIEANAAAETVCLSSISSWEVALLVDRGRLRLTVAVDDWVAMSEALPFVRFVPVDNRIALRSVALPEPLHSDPADRIIIATAQTLGATLVTKDERIRAYAHVETVW